MIDISGATGRLKAVYDYLVANLSVARTAKIDNLDATMLSRAAAATAVSSADYTPARGGYLDKLNTGVSGTVKSIQTGYIDTTGTTATGEDANYADIVISTVVVAKCVVTVQSREDGGALRTGRVTGVTTLRVSRDSSSATLRGRWTVVEYY